MDFPTLLALAVALALDATAVSLAAGISLKTFGFRHVFRMAFHFGLFQAGMPLLGWLAGAHLLGWIEVWDHWVAFGLLAFVGGKMILEGAFRKDATESVKDPTRGLSLVMLSVATSIDAFAVGMSLAVMNATIIAPCIVIGVVTVVMSAGGMLFGRQLGLRFGRGMTVAGGLVLIAIGVRLLIEHL